MADFYGGIPTGSWRIHVAAWVSQQDNGRALVRCETRFQAVNGWSLSSINGNYGATVSGQTATASTQGGINVGQNAEQTIAVKEVWVNKGHGSQNVGVGGYINITGFQAGSSSAYGTVGVGARPSWKVTYNANGGSGAPGQQTKWYGEKLNLSGARSTRTNYTFQGWATSATGGVAYQPGGQYNGNAAITLYAVWKLAFKPPVIDQMSVQRCTSNGTNANDGTYCKLIVKWHADTSMDSANAGVSIAAGIAKTGTPALQSTAVSGTNGTWQKVIAGAAIDSSWVVLVQLTDKHQSVKQQTTLGPSTFIMDVSSDGKGVGIGQAAPSTGVAITGNPVTINGIQPIAGGVGSGLNKAGSLAPLSTIWAATDPVRYVRNGQTVTITGTIRTAINWNPQAKDKCLVDLPFTVSSTQVYATLSGSWRGVKLHFDAGKNYAWAEAEGKTGDWPAGTNIYLNCTLIL